MAHAGGRPTKYNLSVNDELDKYLETTGREQMSLPTIQGFALWLNVDDETLTEWAKIYPEFSATFKRLKQLQAQQLINDGIYGGKEVNSTIVKLLLQNNHGMRERTETEIGGIMDENGKRSEIGLFINAGQGFIPATVSLSASPNGGTQSQSAEIQSTRMAQKSPQDLHSNNGTGKTSTH